MNKLLRRSWIFLPVFFLITLVFYWPARHALLIDDGISILTQFKKQGWSGVSTSFGFTSLYYVHDLICILVFLIVGKSTTGWFLVMTAFHSANSFFILKIFRRVYQKLEIRNGFLIAVSGAVLFLVSPYQSENVAWAATLHYGLSMALLFSCIWLLLNFLESGKTVALFLIPCLLGLSLLTLEISIVFPFVLVLIFLLYFLSGCTQVSLRKFAMNIFLPSVFAVLLYASATKLLKGSWLPHYGDEHLKNLFNPALLLKTLSEYSEKIFGFVHYLSFPKRELVYEFSSDYLLTSLILFLATISIGYFMFRSGGKKMLYTFSALCALLIIFLLPVLNMYFMYIFQTENNRLSYFALVLAFQILALVSFGLLKKSGWIVLGIYTAASVIILPHEVTRWAGAAQLQNAMVSTYKWEKAHRVYILNSPSNFGGAYVFRKDYRFGKALYFFRDIDAYKTIDQIAWANFNSLSDSVKTEKVNDSTLHVILAAPGSWLMHENLGASPRETEWYSFKPDEWNTGYLVLFKQKKPDDVFLYVTSTGLHEVKDF